MQQTSLHELSGLWSIDPSRIGLASSLQAHYVTLRSRDQLFSVDYGSYDTIDGCIAVFELCEVLTKGMLYGDPRSSTQCARMLVKRMMNDPSIRGVLLAIDSPGGTIAGAGDLAQDIAALNAVKPVHAYLVDLCVGTAYWIASQAESISTGRTAIIGGIGISTTIVDSSKAYENAGVKVHIVKAGAFKGGAVPGTKVTDQKIKHDQAIVDTYAGLFVDAVAKGRKLPVKQVRELADGKTYVGEKARKAKLVDKIQSMDDAIDQLRQRVTPKGD